MPRLVYTRIEGEFENADDAAKIVAAAVGAAIGREETPRQLTAPAVEILDPKLLAAPAVNGHNGNGHSPEKRKYTKRSPVTAESKDTTGPAGGQTAQMCLAVIKKKALTSGEVFDAIRSEQRYKGELGAVYACLAVLKKNGILESRIDEEDGGTRKWYLAN